METELKYIGQRIVKSLSPYGEDAYFVTYEDGHEEILAKVMFDAIVSDSECDATALRDKRVETVTKVMLELFKRYNVEISEMDKISQVIALSVNDSFIRANNILWGTKDRTFLDIDRILKSKKIPLSEIVKDVDK